MKTNPDSLMGDLETIRELLEEEDWQVQPDNAHASNPEPSVAKELAQPDDKVGSECVQSEASEERADASAAIDDLTELNPTTTEPDTQSDSQSDTQSAAHPSAQVNTTPGTLLDRAFTAEADLVMGRARALIEEHPNAWSPQQTDELCDALKVRIDDTIHQWIDETLARHRNVLEERLVRTIQNELAEHLQLLEIDSGAPVMGSQNTNNG